MRGQWQHLILASLDTIVDESVLLIVQGQQGIGKSICLLALICGNVVVDFLKACITACCKGIGKRDKVWRAIVDGIVGRLELANKQVHDVLCIVFIICSVAGRYVGIPAFLLVAL